MKKINNYRLQYWLYAILNKKFGGQVIFKRDVLHNMYSVNRHGFTISSNTISLEKVNQYLEEYLKQCRYIENNKCGKYFQRENIYISIYQYENNIYCVGRVY